MGFGTAVLRRCEEDVAAVRGLGARLVHGGLPDAIYRTDKNRSYFYAERKESFSQPSSEDFIYPDLSTLLKNWVEEIQPDLLLCPLAVGRHVDHAVVTESFRNEFIVVGNGERRKPIPRPGIRPLNDSLGQAPAADSKRYPKSMLTVKLEVEAVRFKVPRAEFTQW